ncbi:MAG: arginine--tRNA ligase [Acidobacteria bacterium]|nr:arginine--tRNA ligase [Acidobacteriota bacterium]
MIFRMKQEVERTVRQALESAFPIEPGTVAVSFQYPARPEHGDLSTTFPFDLAKVLRQAPARIAERFREVYAPPAGVARVTTAGGGYVNFHLDRGFLFTEALEALRASVFQRAFDPVPGKTIVEHTNINPNKAAHVGHLRNAILGDSLVRLMRFAGETVEVQNYLDNTGVQVADVVVGFLHLEKMTLEGVRRIPGKFDDVCWDLYARVAEFYERSEENRKLRYDVLHAIEAGVGEAAEMAAHVSDRVARCHLATMRRLGIVYDVLPRESDILRLHFWDKAFGLLRDKGVVTLEAEGPNAGCWVMKYLKDGAEDVKIMVRSNGTVTYTGKDVAYQLWKLGKLEKDFFYLPYETRSDGGITWVSHPEPPPPGTPPPPAFGSGDRVYNVIDVRQSYTQNIVYTCVALLEGEEAFSRCVHFSYEMVALSPRCAEALGFALSDEEKTRSHVEVSGRRGLGVKADDLVDRLENRAHEEVVKRHPEAGEEVTRPIARDIAAGALRYFMARFTRNSLLVFDLDDALNFDGETGPYLQYSAVRAANIQRKYAEAYGETAEAALERLRVMGGGLAAGMPDDVWDLFSCLLKMRDAVRAALNGQEIATFARYLYTLSQKFSFFYNRRRIIGETDEPLRLSLLALVSQYLVTMRQGLDLLGIRVPDRM